MMRVSENLTVNAGVTNKWPEGKPESCDVLIEKLMDKVRLESVLAELLISAHMWLELYSAPKVPSYDAASKQTVTPNPLYQTHTILACKSTCL